MELLKLTSYHGRCWTEFYMKNHQCIVPFADEIQTLIDAIRQLSIA